MLGCVHGSNLSLLMANLSLGERGDDEEMPSIWQVYLAIMKPKPEPEYFSDEWMVTTSNKCVVKKLIVLTPPPLPAAKHPLAKKKDEKHMKRV